MMIDQEDVLEREGAARMTRVLVTAASKHGATTVADARR
jgi:hypothetical protein